MPDRSRPRPPRWRSLAPVSLLGLCLVVAPATAADPTAPATTAPATRDARTAPATRDARTAPATRDARTAPAASVSEPSPSASPVNGPSPAASPVVVELLGYEVVSRRPHDTSAWTEGLVFDTDGRLFESTGLTGRSSVREVDPASGAVLRSSDTPGSTYGEGLALVGDRLIQLTWKDGLAFAWDRDTLELLETWDYAGQGEGWGLCHDGRRLVMSDGSDVLTFRDPATFAPLGGVTVTIEGEPLGRLNELECDGDVVWANVWETDWIVRIDPASGAVTGALDTTGLLVPHPAATDRGAVLNGIATVPGAGTYLLTGKLWPEAIEVRITSR